MLEDLYSAAAGQARFDAALPDYEQLLSCIRCGRCLPVCPTYQETCLETFSPRGRLNLLRAVEDGKLELTRGVEEHLYHCLDCRACNTVCPPGIRIGELILDGREAAARKRPRPRLLSFALRRILVNPRRAEIFLRPLRFAQALGVDRLAGRLAALLPRAGARLRDLIEMAPRLTPPPRRELAPVTAARGPRRHRVAYFLGCIMNAAYGDTSRTTVRLLTRLGCEVVTPRGQLCCGAPHDDQGMKELARSFARRNIALFEPALEQAEAVVSDCAGCSGALKEYAEWLHDDSAWRERARRFSAKVRDVTEWIDAHWPADLEPHVAPLPVAYHDPCHLSNVQGVRQQPRRLLERIRGLDLREIPESMPTRCCGSAGIYNITHPGMSMALMDGKMRHIASTGAATVVTANPGCMLQLQWGSRRGGGGLAVRHVVEILEEALKDD